MQRHSRNLIICVCFLFIYIGAAGQSQPNRWVKLSQLPPDQNPLQNGKLYQPGIENKSQNPYLTYSWNNVIIELNNYHLADTLIARYDILNDQLVCRAKTPYEGLVFTPVSSTIKSFRIKDQFFVYLAIDSLNNKVLKPGFYEKMYSMNSYELYTKHRKEIIDNEQQLSYKYRTEIILQKDKRFFILKKKKDVIEVLSPDYPDIASFARKNKLRYKRNLLEDLTFTLNYMAMLNGSNEVH